MYKSIQTLKECIKCNLSENKKNLNHYKLTTNTGGLFHKVYEAKTCDILSALVEAQHQPYLMREPYKTGLKQKHHCAHSLSFSFMLIFVPIS